MRLLIAAFLLALSLVAIVDAQNKGGAKPRQITFAAGIATIAGSMKNGQQIDYVFSAVKGQSITIRNTTKSQFDFRVYNETYFSDGDFDSSSTYTFEIPETAVYLFTIRKKATGTRAARYSLRLTFN